MKYRLPILATAVAAVLTLLSVIRFAFAQTVVVASCPSGTVVGAPGQTGRVYAIDINGNQCIGGTLSTASTIGITPTDRTVTSATGSSQQIMAANAARHSLTIENTGNANCGVNPTGGTAAIGGAGTLTLAPLGSYSPRVPPLSAVTVICTAGQPIYADEN